MTITEEIIEEKFREYNREYFNNELPLPKFGLLKSYMTCGYFSCKKIIGKRKLKGQRLDISVYYDWDEDELKSVIVHEMIHYYLAHKHIDNELTHGEAFNEMAKEFNEKYGLKISAKVDCTGFKKTKNAPRFSWFLVRMFV
jgi:hypothetical protein